MSLMNVLTQMAVQQFAGKTSQGSEGIAGALTQLLPMVGGDLNLGSLVEKFTSNGNLMSLAASWLGNGGNLSINPSQIISALGQNEVGNFASQLGMGENDAASGLANIIPDFIDKHSENGEVKSDALAGIASSVLGGLFK